ncbi:MAG: cell division ATP-binding protein FtsE [Gemmatimonas sp.]|jgi:cell division transport system ATP-binding protein|nr:cell division ATP-binding protein FtsE [Gemmatimonas sp.]MCE2952792.1 cell division ATP-binding protein FtsE [Gemmatimonas sp.]MCZ8012002.1 cell division ATP-binding protein FtsE [Gemmatimonas sp.]MCZ8267320.1 cell division ATP-binding protein FtsE [Gemmatimonas sp.]
MSEILRVTNVSKEYPRSGMALRDVSFEMQKGEFVFLVGHSGAGKSTLLKLLTMAERPTAGEVRVSGFSSFSIQPRDVPQLRRRLGVVFQDFRLLPDRTAEQNIAFALEVTGTPGAQIAPKVARLLTQVGLAARATAYPHELSGGEQQRVAIARALANDPFLLLADEPTGNLDDRATHAIYLLLREINARGTSVLMATHDVAMIQRAGMRCLELDHGQLVFDGTDVGTLVANMRGRRG